MFKNYNKYAVLKVFLFNATDSFRLRELGRMANLAPLSVSNYLKEFEKEGLVKKFKKRGIPFYQAQRDSDDFRFFQRLAIQYELRPCTNHIWEKYAPRAIIIYGSFVSGDAIDGSDIDLFILGDEFTCDLKKFEKQLGHAIHLMFSDNLRNVSDEFRNNLINGIVLKGYLHDNPHRKR